MFDAVPLDPRYLEGIRLFNRRDFFACHDVLEDLWTETVDHRKSFYQGLIHSAVALFHFGNGNLGGARKMSLSAQAYLDPYQPVFLRMDVTRFLADFAHCFAELIGHRGDYPFGLKLAEDRIPRITLTRPAQVSAQGGTDE